MATAKESLGIAQAQADQTLSNQFATIEKNWSDLTGQAAQSFVNATGDTAPTSSPVAFTRESPGDDEHGENPVSQTAVGDWPTIYAILKYRFARGEISESDFNQTVVQFMAMRDSTWRTRHLQWLNESLQMARIAKGSYTNGFLDRLEMSHIWQTFCYKDGGFTATIWRHRTSNEIVVGFAGTEPTEDFGADIFEDIAQGSWLVPGSSQYGKAESLMRALIEKYPNSRFTVTGHSLGGGLAASVSLKLNIPATIFNGAGVHPFTVMDYTNSSDRLIDAFIVAKEPLSTFQNFDDFLLFGSSGNSIPNLGPNTLGRRHYLYPSGIPFLQKHGMDAVIAGLENEIRLLNQALQNRR